MTLDPCPDRRAPGIRGLVQDTQGMRLGKTYVTARVFEDLDDEDTGHFVTVDTDGEGRFGFCGYHGKEFFRLIVEKQGYETFNRRFHKGVGSAEFTLVLHPG